MVGLILRVVVSLALVLGLFWLAARAGSRRFSTGPRSLMRVRGRQSLSRTASLAVVEVGSRLLVVGISDGGVRLLTELDPFELEQPEAGRPAADGEDVSPETRTVPGGPVSGSLLSAQTWKQAWLAATSRQSSHEPSAEEESA